ncbi:nucleoside diphosphate-linked moiety X motif 19 [Rhinatrema bivittatum]|uniref:nucleoside diphosphate-linked moiety X motif 19 n=1 Tax=Rhinatrema bivittatum TaxID=194408 RepID=UPI00112786FA|nr:nucleoside diphosphate-linked moiety X motif 19 [Rhinatrema bivittatum]XP_029464273.1 nucleoside diphosphate-linked moiety X motif 19 [Rhinatrema bivittatum]XP_029464274.1 nucleoside diphosphate-linked moiety X motif 19 [Rhinatrema bivittatum]
MNVTLTHWREAASLIVAAALRGAQAVLKHSHGSGLEVQTRLPQNTFDYRTLLLQRSPMSSFLPNAHVFPGGLVDAADFSNRWLNVFKSHAQKPNFGLPLVKQDLSTRCPIFLTDRTKFGSLVPGEVAFRICAIRETFEESGILLVVPESCDTNSSQPLTKVADYDHEELARWRLKVQSDPAHFLQMCTELGCMPNIWALHEWGNWLTPAISQNEKKRRYDTAFFICCLEEKPHTIDDQKEITSFKWLTPPEAIELWRAQKIRLAPPQFYELSRMCHFSSLSELHRFNIDRASEGCERWLPVILIASDGFMQLLPGDELYPEEPDWTGEMPILSVDKKREDLRKKDSKLHRIEHQDHQVIVYMNIVPNYKHISPLITDPKDEAHCNSRL